MIIFCSLSPASCERIVLMEPHYLEKIRKKLNQEMCKISNHAYPYNDSICNCYCINLRVHLTIFYFSCSIENCSEYNLELSNICYNNFHNHGKRINLNLTAVS